jgi:hypothetical protein
MFNRFLTFMGRVLLLLLGLLVGLGLAELYVRGKMPDGSEIVLEAKMNTIPASLYIPDRELRIKLRPRFQVQHRSLEYQTTIRTNGIGLRSQELEKKDFDEIRILTIGDSFTLGIQVEEEETAGAQMGTILTKKWRRPVTIWNAGVDGYGTEQSLILAERLLKQVQPEILFLRFYLGNDLRDNYLWSNADASSSIIIEEPRNQEAWRNFHKKISSVSRLYAYVLTYKSIYDRSKDPRIQEMADEVLPFVDAQNLEKLLPNTKSAFEKMQEMCSRFQITCVVSWAPPAYVVHSNRKEETFKVFGLDHTQMDHKGMMKRIESILPKGILSCDPTPELLANEEQSLYYTFDPHWNVLGHSIVGQSEANCLYSKIKPNDL